MTQHSATSWLASALLAVASSSLARPAVAQAVPTGKQIHIHLKGNRTNPEGSNPYQIHKVLPNSKGVCRGAANQREDCYEEVSWVLKGPGLPAGWYVEVRPKASAAKKCYSAAPFVLRNGAPVTSGPIDAKACDRFDVWPYDVVLLDGNGKEKDLEDPLVVINY